MTTRVSLLFLLTVALGNFAWSDTVPAKPGTYLQEVAEYALGDNGLPSTDVQRIYIKANGEAVAVTAEGAATLSGRRWKPESRKTRVSQNDPYKQDIELRNRVRTLVDQSFKIQITDGDIRQVAVSPDGKVAAATTLGLLIEVDAGGTLGDRIVRLSANDGQGRLWGQHDVRGVAYDSNGRLWFAVLAGVAVHSEAGKLTYKDISQSDAGIGGWTFFTGQDGLPYNDITCVAAGADGSVWFGTTKGAIRFDGLDWQYRQGRRWLPDDNVRDIAVDAKGTAWFATANGVGRIVRKPMTLAQKAAVYEEEVDKYIKRTEYGYTAEVTLKSPNDFSEIQHHDSDNDGLWTSMYGAGECYAYAATGNPEAKMRAKQAFEALRFLQKVTQGGEHSPPKGYVARTILPTSGRDPNVGRIERDRESQKEEYLWKVYEPRWPKSADGQWYWKSDTSSDELDGHYFFYPLYHDLVADTEAEKERAREVIRDLTDHFLAHDFQLIDHDGKVTRWGTFSPKDVNGNKDWYTERSLNSLSMLSYLTVAEHMTGDAKYTEAIQLLIDEHHYDQNVMWPKFQFGIGSGNQSDDEMAFMSFYNLLRYSKHEALKEKIAYGFFSYWKLESPEMNPFFNFAYAAVNTGANFTDPWGTYDLSPWNGWLNDSMETLLGFSLDRRNWGHQNSHRTDLVDLRRLQGRDPTTFNPRRRAHRVNGKVLPVQERHFNHWNTDPYVLDYGGNGQGLANGTVFLLPYYMGLYHGFIKE